MNAALMIRPPGYKKQPIPLLFSDAQEARAWRLSRVGQFIRLSGAAMSTVSVSYAIRALAGRGGMIVPEPGTRITRFFVFPPPQTIPEARALLHGEPRRSMLPEIRATEFPPRLASAYAALTNDKPCVIRARLSKGSGDWLGCLSPSGHVAKAVRRSLAATGVIRTASHLPIAPRLDGGLVLIDPCLLWPALQSRLAGYTLYQGEGFTRLPDAPLTGFNPAAYNPAPAPPDSEIALLEKAIRAMMATHPGSRFLLRA
jgi:hypothetical protein